jgi:hypothetical protein
LSADRSWTIAAGITGSGATGQVAYWNGTSSQTGSNNLFWDAANARLGIGTNSPQQFLHVIGSYAGQNDQLIPTIRVTNSLQTTGVNILSNFRTNVGNGVNGGFPDLIIQAYRDTANVGSIGVRVLSNHPLIFSTNDTERARIFAGGNFGIGTGATDGGQRLQVQGDAFIKGSGATSATNALLIQNSSGVNLLQVVNDRSVYIGVSGLSLNITTSSVATDRLPFQVLNDGVSSNFTVSSIVGSRGGVEIHNIVTTAMVVNPTSGSAQYRMYSVSPTINQTGGANGITRGLYINPTLTAAADWRAIEVSAGVSVLAPSTTASATLRIPSGTAPTSPVNGDIWFDGTDLKMRIGGVTKTFTLV